MKKGDYFTIEGEYLPRPWWKRAWWRLRYFKMLPFEQIRFEITEEISVGEPQLIIGPSILDDTNRTIH